MANGYPVRCDLLLTFVAFSNQIQKFSPKGLFNAVCCLWLLKKHFLPLNEAMSAGAFSVTDRCNRGGPGLLASKSNGFTEG
jgi:hypothetical protein